MDETASSLFLDRELQDRSGRRAPHRAPPRVSEPLAPPEQTWDLTRAFIAKSLLATFLWLGAGAILLTSSTLSNATCAAALACALAGIAVLFLARRQLRRALLDREIARGTPRERAAGAVEIELDRIAGDKEVRWL
jgi:hypothetical protein